MKQYIILIILISWTGLISAQQSIRINTDQYTGVVVEQPLDFYLHHSDSSYIEVSGSGVQLQKIKVEIKNGTLYLHAGGAENLNAKYHFYSPKYNYVSLSSASTLHGGDQLKGEKILVELNGASDARLNLDYKYLNANISGASDLWVFGRVDSIQLRAQGASDFDAYGAKNIYTKLEASGSSDVSVNPDSVLIAGLSGASELKYKKEPAHKFVKTSGSSEYRQCENSKDKVELNGMKVEESGDTVRIDLGNGKREFIIIDGDNGVSIKTRKNRIRFRGNWAGVELGVNGYITPKGSINVPAGYEFLDLRYEKSTNFNLNFFQQSVNLIDNKLGLVTGLGFRWNNYRFDNNVVLVPDSQEIYGYHNHDSTRSYSKSKLMSCYLTLPLILEFQTNPYHNSRSFHIGLGVIGGVRMKTHTKQVYTTSEGSKSKPKTHDDFHLQPFTLDATLRIGWGPINLYATYSLIDMFRKGQGPELRPFSVGIILPFT